MRREAAWEYLRGALWVMPTAAVVVALAAGSGLSQVDMSADNRLVFQGTADDARTLLIAIASTMATVIAVVLGLTVVALQLASTQFSPRILRNFLRDRINKIVLSIFVATFTFSTAGLYTVGVSAGQRVDTYPRLAVSTALVLLFVSLVTLVVFVHHLAHSIQIDAIMVLIERTTVRVVTHDLPAVEGESLPQAPVWAVEVPSYKSGYVQTVHPEQLIAAATEHDVTIAVTTMIGEYVIADAPLLRIWRSSPEQPAPDPAIVQGVLRYAVRIGRERTAEQDVAFGIRQLADIAVKALSPAINDPYTSIQCLEHLGVVLANLVRRPLGGQQVLDTAGVPRVLMPGRDLDYYLDLATGQIRRYGGSEPRVVRALLRVLDSTGRFCRDDTCRAVVAHHVRLVLEAAETEIRQSADLAPVRDHATQVLRRVTG